MRLADIVIAAVVGGAIGFAASHYVAGQRDETAAVEAMIDARVADRLAALGLEDKGALDGRISGGVAQFLADQPEAVYAALEQHQANIAAAEEEERRQTVANLGPALFEQPEDPAFGATEAEADVTLVEFFDYRCGYCKRSLETVLALAETDPKLRVVMKEFPILGPESIAATRVSLAAYRTDPAPYRDFHAALMRHRGGYDKEALLQIAAEAGYDPAAVAANMEDEAISKQIRNSYEIAEALGIRGTPAFVVGDRVIPGAVSADSLRDAIETTRAARKG